MPALYRAIVALATPFTWRSTRFGARFRADPFTQRQKTQDANDHCFFNLRWNFVCQRSQHLLSRLARHYQVVFVEEPVPNGDDFLEQGIRRRRGGDEEKRGKEFVHRYGSSKARRPSKFGWRFSSPSTGEATRASWRGGWGSAHVTTNADPHPGRPSGRLSPPP